MRVGSQVSVKAQGSPMTWSEWTDLIPLLGVLGAVIGMWWSLAKTDRPQPPTVITPSEAQAADREARADSLEEAVDAAGPHSDGTDSDGPTDSEVDDWIEDKD